MANLLIQPAPVPSISKSMQNALAMKSMQLQTELAQRKFRRSITQIDAGFFNHGFH